MISVLYNNDSSLSRKISTNDCALQYKKIKSYFYTDTLVATKGMKSTHGNICAQIFVLDKGFLVLYPLKDQRSYFLALKEFAKDVGLLKVLVSDAHSTQTKWEVKKLLIHIETILRSLRLKRNEPMGLNFILAL